MMQGKTPEHSDTVGLADNPPPHASEHGPKRTDESYYDSYYMACGDPSSACAALLRLPHTSHMPQHSPSILSWPLAAPCTLRRLVTRVLRWEDPRPEGEMPGGMAKDRYSEISSRG